MLTELSFLRSLPKALDPATRMNLEAVAYAVNSLSNSARLLYSSIGNAFVEDREWTFEDQVSSFSQAWLIVDQAHMLKGLLGAYSRTRPELPVLTEFRRKYHPVTMMRNGMDHIQGNLGNIAKKKGKVVPLFGVITVCVPIFDGPGGNSGPPLREAIGKKMITFIASSLTHDSHDIPLPGVHDTELEDPLGPIHFSAFDQTINITGLIRDVASIVNYFESTVRSEVRSAAENLSTSRNIPLDDLLSPQPAISRIECDVLFGAPPELP